MSVDYRRQYKPEHLEPFFPNEIVKFGVVILCTLAVIMLLVILPTLLEGLGVGGIFHEEQPADPQTTPPNIRPEWYFLAVYQYLKLMPQEILGIDGKALGILTQGIGIFLLLFLPFWFPLSPARLEPRDWRRGALTFASAAGLFVLAAIASEVLRALLPEAYRDVLHPMFVWPVAAAGSACAAGWAARRAGFRDAFGWLMLFGVGCILVGFQFVAFIVVLGQGLSWALSSSAGYWIGAPPFVAATACAIAFLVLRATGRDERLRWKALGIFVTEGIVLALGLTIWAMWPAKGLWAEGGWTSEAKGFGFSLFMILVAVVVFFALVITERLTIRHTLGPPEERRRMP